MKIQFLTPIIQPAFNRNAGCGSDMMTDKVRIDTLRADLLDANNETFLALIVTQGCFIIIQQVTLIFTPVRITSK
nr:hypothetical protein [Klebsiella quasipneumoniae]